MPQTPIVVLSGRDLQELLRHEVAIAAFRETTRPSPAVAANTADRSPSRSKAAKFTSYPVLLPVSHVAFAAKVNVNPAREKTLRGLPTIQRVVVVWDAKIGGPVAVMDSVTLIGIRAAATTALAAQYDA